MMGGNGTAVCVTAACQQLANVMIAALASDFPKIDPCSDFDKCKSSAALRARLRLKTEGIVACNGWVAKHPFQPGQTEVSSSDSLRERVGMDIKDVLEGAYPTGSAAWLATTFTPVQSEADRSNFAQLQRVYQSCVRNEPATGLRDLQALMKIIADLYPVPSQRHNQRRRGRGLDQDTEKSVAMGRTLTFFVQNGLPSFISLAPSDPRANPEPTKSNLVLGLGRDLDDIDFMQRPLRFAPNRAYYELGADVLSAVHPARLTRDASRVLMEGVVDLEIRMVQAVTVSDPAKNITLQELDRIAPHLNLSHVIRSMTWPALPPEVVLTDRPGFIANASRALLGNTTEATIQAFFMWKAIKKVAPWVGAEVTNHFLLREGGEDINGKTAIFSGDAQACIAAMDKGPWTQTPLTPDSSTLGWALGRFFVEKSYPPAARNASTALMRHLQRHFAQKIQAAAWLPEPARNRTRDRVDSVQLIMGSAEAFLDPLFSQARAPALAATLSDSNVLNALALARADTARLWRWLTQVGDPVVALTPATVNAQYQPWAHAIVVPAGMARFAGRPADSPLPAYATYGYYGSMLAHELGHILDGSAATLVGWEAPAEAVLRDRLTCLQKQYDGFTYAGRNGSVLHVRGAGTLGENVADLHGLGVSFAAWQELQRVPETRDLRLPGLEGFTMEQLFFLSCKSFALATPGVSLDPFALLFRLGG